METFGRLLRDRGRDRDRRVTWTVFAILVMSLYLYHVWRSAISLCMTSIKIIVLILILDGVNHLNVPTISRACDTRLFGFINLRHFQRPTEHFLQFGRSCFRESLLNYLWELSLIYSGNIAIEFEFLL